jgi:hypothetical protein
MIPDAFASKYPQLAATLMAVKSQEPIIALSATMVDAAADHELPAACNDEAQSVGLVSGIFGGQPQPDQEFMRFSMAVYRQLKASEASRIFVGRIWAGAAQAWDSENRIVFLSLLVRDPDEVFETLDIAVELFHRVQFTAEEVFPWITQAHARVVNDIYQRGFWGCVEAFCNTSSRAAVVVAGRWLDTTAESRSLNAVSNMIGWLRIAVRADRTRTSDFVELEERVKAAGYPAWRALYIESWARGDGILSITEHGALDIRDRYVQAEGEEVTAWCFLLSSVIHSKRDFWHWAHRELRSVALPRLDEASKYWAVAAALHGIDVAKADDAVPASAWRDLFRALLPIATSSVGTWQNVHNTLASLADTDSHGMRELVRTIAGHSAQTWLQTLRHKNFAWFFQILKTKGLAQAVSADLCLAPGAGVRQLGIMVFDECGIQYLDAAAVRSASATQVELLLLEAQRRQIGYPALARLHGCLVDRVDEIGENLPELFYEEVRRQSMNTHEYRVALASARPEHEYLQAIVTDVQECLAAIGKASRSSAFRMQVPGQVRAQKLHDRRFAREVSHSVKEHSTFLNLFPTIHMLYGGMEPRIFSREGVLSPPVQMHSSSSSVEVPQLEFIDPDGMCMRRLAAASRVAALEPTTADGDNDQ